MIKTYSTLNIDGRNPYCKDIGKILSSHRGHEADPKILKTEGDGFLMLYVVGLHAVASLRYFCHRGYVYVNLVHTLLKYRGRGYSSALFAGLIRRYEKIRLEVDKDNVPAVSLYKKMGFVHKKTDGQYWIMQRG